MLTVPVHHMVLEAMFSASKFRALHFYDDPERGPKRTFLHKIALGWIPHWKRRAMSNGY